MNFSEEDNAKAKLKVLYDRQIELEQELNHATAIESIKNIIQLTKMV